MWPSGENFQEREEKLEVVVLLQAWPGGQWDERWSRVIGRGVGKGAGAGACGAPLRSLDFILRVMGATRAFEHETGLISFMF